MNNRADHWSGIVNFISTGGSRRPASASFAFRRSAAALAASRSPACAAQKNSASTFLNRSRRSSSIAMPLLLAQHDDTAPSGRQSATRRRPHLFCDLRVRSSYRLQSKGEPLRRLEVFTGSGRRRAWSAEQKARILAESYESGDEVSAVARRHGLTPQQLFGWRRDVRRRSTRRQSNDAAEMSFAPVLVETGGPHAGPPCPTATGTIEIALGAAVVRVGPGTDLATLTKVLRAVKAAT